MGNEGGAVVFKLAPQHMVTLWLMLGQPTDFGRRNIPPGITAVTGGRRCAAFDYFWGSMALGNIVPNWNESQLITLLHFLCS